jgi:hypothetical protein
LLAISGRWRAFARIEKTSWKFTVRILKKSAPQWRLRFINELALKFSLKTSTWRDSRALPK